MEKMDLILRWMRGPQITPRTRKMEPSFQRTVLSCNMYQICQIRKKRDPSKRNPKSETTFTRKYPRKYHAVTMELCC